MTHVQRFDHVGITVADLDTAGLAMINIIRPRGGTNSPPPTVRSTAGPPPSSTRSPPPDRRTGQQPDRRIQDFARALGPRGHPSPRSKIQAALAAPLPTTLTPHD